MLEELEFLSINQMAAVEKFSECWRWVHVEDYPLDEVLTLNTATPNTRAAMGVRLLVRGSSKLKCANFGTQGPLVWNSTPEEIRCCTDYKMAREMFEEYARKHIPR